MKSRLTLLVVAASLIACSTPQPTAADLALADYGPYPDKYQLKIANYLRSTLKDPDSAKLTEPLAPAKTYAGLSQPVYGWGTCIGVNAKNSFGGYTGSNMYFFLFRNGEISMVERADNRPNSFDTEYVHKLCKQLI